VLYRLFVPEGKTNVTFTLSGGTGDPDIYVRRGTPPTASASGSTCRSENDVGVTETCSIANPATGTWYVLINLFDPYAGWTLKGTYTP
jgi:pseudolysin/vibriolysin